MCALVVGGRPIAEGAGANALLRVGDTVDAARRPALRQNNCEACIAEYACVEGCDKRPI